MSLSLITLCALSAYDNPMSLIFNELVCKSIQNEEEWRFSFVDISFRSRDIQGFAIC